MSGSLTHIIKGLSLGLLMAFAIFFAGDAHASPERIALPVDLSLKQEIGAVAAALCHHAPKKRHCKRAGHAVATIVEPGARRKAGKPEARDVPAPIAASTAESAIHRSDGPHLGLSYGAVYAATRRMHI